MLKLLGIMVQNLLKNKKQPVVRNMPLLKVRALFNKLSKFKIQDTFFTNKVISCNEYNIAHIKNRSWNVR